MADKVRIKIAAAVTALFLAGISVAGLAVRDDHPPAATAATAPAIAAPATARARGDDNRYEAERYEDAEDDE
jgi:hypothetical protein